MADDAVTGEPVSRRNSLLKGKFYKNWAVQGGGRGCPSMGSSTSEITSRTLRDTRRGRNPDQAGGGPDAGDHRSPPARAGPGG
jgi:hypothetical protein